MTTTLSLRRLRRWWLLLVLIGGFLLPTVAFAPAASAHATVASSDPADGARLAAAPAQVSITFDEPVGLDLGYLKAIDSNGTSLGVGLPTHPGGQGQTIALDLQTGLGDGTYIVSWRVISADSHPVEGTIRFVVGNGALSTAAIASTPVVAASTSVVFDIVRTASYVSLVLLGGAWLLLTVWPAGRGVPGARRVLIAGWALAVAAAIGETLVQGAYAAGTGLGSLVQVHLVADTLSTNYGRMHLLRILLLAAVGVLLDAMLAVQGATSPVRVTRGTARHGIPGMLLFLAVIFTFSDSGHAAVARPGWLALSSDMLHLLAMSTWIGGLVMLTVALLPAGNRAELRTVLPVFSRTAMVCVLVIAATGTYQAWRESGTVKAMTTTTYGLLVLLKIVLFLGLLLLGNLSRVVIQRRWVRTPDPVPDAVAQYPAAVAQSPGAVARSSVAVGRSSAADGQSSAADARLHDVEVDPSAGSGPELRRMRRSVVAELVLAAVVLGASGLLVAQAPGRTAVAATPPPSSSATAALAIGRSVTVTVDPARHGTVTVDVTLTGGTAPAQIAVSATLPAQELGPLPVPLTRKAPSQYESQGLLLPSAGRWTFEILVQTSEFDATTADVQIPIS